MSRELELWSFVVRRLRCDESVMLLVVGESTGSSPGRAGYKMAVAEDGELCGSIGGGVMEVALAEKAKAVLSAPRRAGVATGLCEQVHRKNVPNSSGMICSGRQLVIFRVLTPDDLNTVQHLIDHLTEREPNGFEISDLRFEIIGHVGTDPSISFTQKDENQFVYRERLGHTHALFIVGGGHCALALSELMSKLNFRITILDDRPSLNTLKKNRFADEITHLDSYGNIAEHIPGGDNIYVVVMTLGYASDTVVIKQLVDHDLKYLGVLGSRAKMAMLMKELKAEGLDADKLARIYTPIGLPINSRTPEEIAISIAAEIIAVRNGAAIRR